MKTLIKSLVLAAAMVVSAQSFAWQATTPVVPTFLENGWYGESFVLKLTGNTVSTGCAAGNEIFSVASTHPSFKIMTNMAIAAYVAKRKIQVVFEPGECNGVNGALLKSVRMTDS